MLLFKLLNPKSLSRQISLSKSNLNEQTESGSERKHSHKQGLAASPSSFFNYNGLGEVLSPISPDQSGRIHFCGTDWPAQLCPQHHSHHVADESSKPPSSAISAGRTVQVVGRQGITLLVATV